MIRFPSVMPAYITPWRNVSGEEEAHIRLDHPLAQKIVTKGYFDRLEVSARRGGMERKATYTIPADVKRQLRRMLIDNTPVQRQMVHMPIAHAVYVHQLETIVENAPLEAEVSHR